MFVRVNEGFLISCIAMCYYLCKRRLLELPKGALVDELGFARSGPSK